MAEYYYFATSLPSLSMDKPNSITYKKFMEDAEYLLSKRDFEDLKKTELGNLSGEGKSEIARQWQEFSNKISSILTIERAKRLGFKGYDTVISDDRILHDRIRDIVEMDNPLEAEKKLLSLYFDFLSSCQAGSPFSTKALMIYSLKLQLAERLLAFDQKKGQEEFQDLFSAVQKEIFR